MQEKNTHPMIDVIEELARSVNAPWHRVNRCVWILAKGKLDEMNIRKAIRMDNFYIDATGDVVIRMD
jgi:type I restriction-modification system DNA methylase subunit